MDRTQKTDEQLAALASHLSTRRVAILQAWRKSVDGDPELTAPSSLPRTQFNDHIPATAGRLRAQVACVAPPGERRVGRATQGGCCRARLAALAARLPPAGSDPRMGPPALVPGGRIGELLRGPSRPGAGRDADRLAGVGGIVQSRRQREYDAILPVAADRSRGARPRLGANVGASSKNWNVGVRNCCGRPRARPARQRWRGQERHFRADPGRHPRSNAGRVSPPAAKKRLVTAFHAG